MLWLFLAALAFGGVFILLSLLGQDHDVDTAAASNLDVAADTGLLGLFSLRNLTWASFAFGGIGVLGVLTRRPAPTVWIAAGAAGALTWALVHLVFRALRRTEVAPMPLDVAVVGSTGTLVVPFNDDGVGVVQFAANGQQQELPARRAPEFLGVPTPHFTACRIESIDAGFAIVSPVA